MFRQSISPPILWPRHRSRLRLSRHLHPLVWPSVPGSGRLHSLRPAGCLHSLAPITLASFQLNGGSPIRRPRHDQRAHLHSLWLFGKGRQPYTDHSGIRWQPQPACDGGETVPSTGTTFSGTEDSGVYDGGIRGIVRCTFHAPPGLYELRLHFAEPGNLEPAHRVVSLAVNAGPTQSVDVVDRAGGDRAATTFIIPGIRPENDGTIHLDFTSEVSPVNAIEILPAPSIQPLPLRIVAASSPFKDDTGTLWLSDRFFRGGRHGQPPDQEHRPSLGLYSSGRIGTFQYLLPAPTGSKYRVTLYFREPWFGQENGAPGGVGSRVFDIYCNGQTVLKDFDILADGHGQSVTKTIGGISPLRRVNSSFRLYLS